MPVAMVYTKKDIEAMALNLFECADADKNGTLDRNELAAVLKHMGITPTPQQLDAIFEDIDDDESGHISKAEFVAFFNRALNDGEDARDRVERRMKSIKKHFDEMDSNGDGKLTLDEFEASYAKTNKKEGLMRRDKALVRSAFALADEDGDGAITFEEYVEALKQHPEEK